MNLPGNIAQATILQRVGRQFVHDDGQVGDALRPDFPPVRHLDFPLERTLAPLFPSSGPKNRHSPPVPGLTSLPHRRMNASTVGAFGRHDGAKINTVVSVLFGPHTMPTGRAVSLLHHAHHKYRS